MESSDIEPRDQNDELLPDSECLIAPGSGEYGSNQISEEEQRNAEKVALDFLRMAVRIRGVRIDRESFLRSELRQRHVPEGDIVRAIDTDVITAGIDPQVLDDIARKSIALETRNSSAASFVAGLGGPIALPVGVPADLAQHYVHAFRVMQKLAYVYGWRSFFDEAGDVTDEVLTQLVVFLGVMLGVGGAAHGLQKFALQVAMPAVEKQVAGKALTRTVWYPIVKKTLRTIGVKITTDTVGKAAGKLVPVVGGFVAGGITFVALQSQSHRLQKTLRAIPSPNGPGSGFYFEDAEEITDSEGNSKTNDMEAAPRKFASGLRKGAGALTKKTPWTTKP